MERLHAVVLKSYDTGNSSEVVHVVSSERGRLSLYARGLKNPKSRLRAILQPLALVEATVLMKEGAELATLRDAAPIEDHHRIAEDFERLALGLLLAEAAASCCEVGHAAPATFEALLRALHDLDPASGKPAPAAACAGMLALLGESGYAPQLADALLAPWPAGEPKPAWFAMDLETGTVHLPGSAQAGPARGESALSPAAVRYLYESGRGSPATLPTSEAIPLLDVLVELSEYHHARPLKAAAFWRSVR